MKDDNIMIGAGCGLLILVLSAIYIPIALWTDRNLDFWASYLKGYPVDVPFWKSMILSLFEPILLLDIVGEIMRAFV